MQKISIFLFILSFNLFAFDDGFVPLETGRRQASDIVCDQKNFTAEKIQKIRTFGIKCEGETFIPDDLDKLVKANIISDTTFLNPDSSSDLWKLKTSETFGTDADTLNLKQTGGEFEFQSDFEGNLSSFDFQVSGANLNGVITNYSIRLGPKAQVLLLNKALLKKLGYKITPAQFIQSFKIAFKSPLRKMEFAKSLMQNHFIKAEKYLKNFPKVWFEEDDLDKWEMITEGEDSNYFIVSDGVAMPSDVSYYNLITGIMTKEVVLGRRILNSLLIPFALTDTPENVELLPWQLGRIVNNQIYFDYEGEEEFSLSYEDARWMAVRILNLNEKDFSEIVNAAHYPIDVTYLLIEKFKSRRNSLKNTLNLNHICDSKTQIANPNSNVCRKFNINNKITLLPNLSNGKLIGTKWDGYGAEYNSDDPNSPIDKKEMKSLFKMKMISNMISNAIDRFNLEVLPHTDIGFKIFDHQLDLAAHEFARFLLTGEIRKVPFGFWTATQNDVNVVTSRDVLAGNYLGTDNVVQLADTLGFVVGSGFYLGADGLPNNMFFQGGAKASYRRIYTHIKPLQNITTAVHEKFAHLLVPLFKRQTGSVFNELSKPQFTKHTDEEKQKLIQDSVKLFKESFGVGESLIISSAIGGDFTFGPGFELAKSLNAQLNFGASHIIMKRTHIYRASENEIHVYDTPTNTDGSTGVGFGTEGISFSLSGEIEYLNLALKTTHGHVNNSFYKIDLETANPNALDNLKALSDVLMNNSTQKLSKLQNPFKFKHQVFERATDFKFLHFRKSGQKLRDEIKITEPSGQSKSFLVESLGKRRGVNIEEFSLEAINAFIKKNITSDIDVQSQSSGNPADTLYGFGDSRIVRLMSELSVENNKTHIENPFVELNYNWKGWKISPDKMNAFIDDLEKKYNNRDLFSEFTLNNTSSVQLYNLGLKLNVYENGIKYLMSLSDEAIKDVFTRNLKAPTDDFSKRIVKLTSDNKKFNMGDYREFIKHIRKYKKISEKGNYRKAGFQLIKMTNVAEKSLNPEGFYELFGGLDNVYIRAVMSGFRVGDDDVDPIQSNGIGEIGSEKPEGSLRELQQEIGITEGELFVYWILRKF